MSDAFFWFLFFPSFLLTLRLHPALSLLAWTVDPAVLVKFHPSCYFILVFAWASIKYIMKGNYQPPSVLLGLYKYGIYHRSNPPASFQYPHLTASKVTNLSFDSFRWVNCKKQSGSQHKNWIIHVVTKQFTNYRARLQHCCIPSCLQ